MVITRYTIHPETVMSTVPVRVTLITSFPLLIFSSSPPENCISIPAYTSAHTAHRAQIVAMTLIHQFTLSLSTFPPITSLPFSTSPVSTSPVPAAFAGLQPLSQSIGSNVSFSFGHEVSFADLVFSAYVGKIDIPPHHHIHRRKIIQIFFIINRVKKY